MEANPKVVVITKDGSRLHGRAMWAERYLKRNPGAKIETAKDAKPAPAPKPVDAPKPVSKPKEAE